MNQQNFRDSLGNSFILLLCGNIALWVMIAPTQIQHIKDLTQGTWKEIEFTTPEKFHYDFWNLDGRRGGADPFLNIFFKHADPNYYLKINCKRLATDLCHVLQAEQAKMLSAQFYVQYSASYMNEIHHQYVLKSFRYKSPQGQLLTQNYHTVPPNHPDLIFKAKRQFLIIALGFSLFFSWVIFDIRHAKYFNISHASFKTCQKLLYAAIAISLLSLWLRLIDSLFFT